MTFDTKIERENGIELLIQNSHPISTYHSDMS